MKYRLTIYLVVGEPVVIDFTEARDRDECWHNVMNGARWNLWPKLGLAIQSIHVVKMVGETIA